MLKGDLLGFSNTHFLFVAKQTHFLFLHPKGCQCMCLFFSAEHKKRKKKVLKKPETNL